MISGTVTSFPNFSPVVPIPFLQGGLKDLYISKEITYAPGMIFDPMKPIKRWIDGYSGINADENYPDIHGNPTVGYLSYRITKAGTVVPFTFRLAEADAGSYNIPSPKETFTGNVPLEIPFPCREIDPVQETLIADAFGGVLVRNIAMWNHQQQTSDKSGFTAQDRATLLMLLNKVSAMEAKLSQGGN